jgi:CRP-like cAMP-binding protein
LIFKSLFCRGERIKIDLISKMETKTREITSVNKLLSTLPKKEYQRILLSLEQVDLVFGEALYKPDDKINFVYFPMSGVVSLLAVEDEATMELGLIGNEGMIGLPVFLGVPISRALVVAQSNTTALRMKATDFLKECEQNALLSCLVRRYTHYLLMQISQAVVCTRLHLIEQRLACILMVMYDRVMINSFQLKHEFLSRILGVRREAITIAAGSLQKKGLITYSRGNLVILDPKGLEGTCCRCYKAVTGEYQNFLAAQKRLSRR